MQVDIKDEINLWRAVLCRAMIDAQSESQRKKDPLYKIDALEWLRGTCEDFVEVCDLAQVDYKQILYNWRKKC